MADAIVVSVFSFFIGIKDNLESGFYSDTKLMQRKFKVQNIPLILQNAKIKRITKLTFIQKNAMNLRVKTR